MNTSLLAGISRHVFQALTFRHDGSGLPQKFGGPFMLLAAIAIFFDVARHLVYGTHPAVGSLIRFPLILMVLFFIFNASRYQLVSIFLCISSGIDLIAAVAGILFGAGLKSGAFFFTLSLWETAAFVVGIVHITKDRGKNT